MEFIKFIGHILLWIFNVVNRHRREVDSYNNSIGGKMLSVFIGIFFGACALGFEYLFIDMIYNPEMTDGVEILAQGMLDWLVQIIDIACFLALLDHSLCFIFVGIRGIFVEGDHPGSRISSFIFTIIHIALTIAVFVAAFFIVKEMDMVFG